MWQLQTLTPAGLQEADGRGPVRQLRLPSYGSVPSASSFAKQSLMCTDSQIILMCARVCARVCAFLCVGMCRELRSSWSLGKDIGFFGADAIHQ